MRQPRSFVAGAPEQAHGMRRKEYFINETLEKFSGKLFFCSLNIELSSPIRFGKRKILLNLSF